MNSLDTSQTMLQELQDWIHARETILTTGRQGGILVAVCLKELSSLLSLCSTEPEMLYILLVEHLTPEDLGEGRAT